MKLTNQFPFYEARILPKTLAQSRKAVDGVDCVEILVVDDNSTNDAPIVAQESGSYSIFVRSR